MNAVPHPLTRSSRAATLALIAVIVTGCAHEVTLRRVVQYPPTGYGRMPLEAPARPRAAAAAPLAGGIEWHGGTLESARAAATRSNKPLLVYVYTSWCGPCKRLASQTFPQPAVVQAARGLVAFKIDGDSSAGKTFCRGLRINSYPTLVFFKASGAEIDRVFGFRGPPQLVQVIGDMIADRNTVGDYRRRLAREPTSIPLRHKLGLQLALRGDTAEAITHLERVVAADPRDTSQLASQSLYVIGRYVHQLKTRDYAAALTAFEQVLARFPRSTAARQAGVEAARLHTRAERRDLAEAALTRMIRGGRQDAQRYLDSANAVLRFKLDQRKGIRWARRACQLREDGYPWSRLAALYGLAGDRRRQLHALEEAVKRSPSNARFQRELERARRATPEST